MAHEIIANVGTTCLHINIPRGHSMYSPLANFLRRKATIWQFEHKWRKWIMVGEVYTYNPLTGSLRVPVGYLPKIQEVLAEHNCQLTTIPNYSIDPRLIDLTLRPGVSPRPHQVKPIEYFTSQEYQPRRGFELQTGKGKTFISIASIVKMGYSSLIICSGLTEQWIDKLHEYVEDVDVYLIQSRKSLDKLFESQVIPQVFVGSLATLRLWAMQLREYNNLPMTYAQFLDNYGIGIKVVDECHLNIEAVCILDLFSNVRHNWYISATFHRKTPHLDTIFDTVYPPSIRLTGMIYDKYTELHYVYYYSGVNPRKTVTNRGYNHPRFEGQLLKFITKYNHLVRVIVAKQLEYRFVNIRRPDQRALIFVSTVIIAEKVRESLTELFPSLRVVTFLGNDEDTKCLTGDVIISVPRKAGTGKDIPGLLTVINTVSMGTAEGIEQMFGRLRKFSNGDTPHFVQLVDKDNTAQQNHAKIHKDICIPRSIRYTEISE